MSLLYYPILCLKITGILWMMRNGDYFDSLKMCPCIINLFIISGIISITRKMAMLNIKVCKLIGTLHNIQQICGKSIFYFSIVRTTFLTPLIIYVSSFGLKLKSWSWNFWCSPGLKVLTRSQSWLHNWLLDKIKILSSEVCIREYHIGWWSWRKNKYIFSLYFFRKLWKQCVASWFLWLTATPGDLCLYQIR